MEEEVKTELDVAGEPIPEADEDMDEAEDLTDIQDDIEDDIAESDDEDGELEYDEDGNLVIEEDAEEAGDTTPQADGKIPATDPAPREDSNEVLKLRRELADLRARSKAALESMGYDGENVTEELDRMAAEAEGKTLEEYRADRDRETAKKAADDAAFFAAFEKKKAADLAAVQAAYPSTKKYTSVDDFPHSQRFKQLCDGGATPEEAFRATHPEDVASHVAAAVKQGARDSKDHLRSNVPKGAKDTGTHITRGELEAYHEMFPTLSDKEIVRLYRRART